MKKKSKAKRLTEKQFRVAINKLWAIAPLPEGRKDTGIAEIPENPEADAINDLLSSINPGVLLPLFDVSLGATSADVSVIEGGAPGEKDSRKISVGLLTPALTTAFASELRDLLEAVEERYFAVFHPLYHEVRDLRDQLAAGYLGHRDTHTVAMDDLEKSSTEREYEEEADAKAAARHDAIEKEIGLAVRKAGLVKPKRSTQVPDTALKRYWDAYRKIADRIRAKHDAARAKLKADSGMVA